jgi:Tol biopolymer transport system component
VQLPRWSPDGRQLAYMLQRPGQPWRIDVLDLSSGAVRQASDGNDSQGAPTWSPDGRSIAALHLERHEPMLYDTGSRKWSKLADTMNGTDLSWSADSRYLYANVPGLGARIVRIRASDGMQETVFDLSSEDKFNVAESDDLLFSLAPDDAIILHRRVHSQEIYAYDLRDR